MAGSHWFLMSSGRFVLRMTISAHMALYATGGLYSPLSELDSTFLFEIMTKPFQYSRNGRYFPNHHARSPRIYRQCRKATWNRQQPLVLVEERKENFIHLLRLIEIAGSSSACVKDFRLLCGDGFKKANWMDACRRSVSPDFRLQA